MSFWPKGHSPSLVFDSDLFSIVYLLLFSIVNIVIIGINYFEILAIDLLNSYDCFFDNLLKINCIFL